MRDGLVFPESPRWHAGALWFSDVFADRVGRLDADGRLAVVAEIQRPSGLGFLPDGTPIVVSMASNELLAIRADGIRRHADLSHLGEGGMLNDMAIDRAGRAYVGHWMAHLWNVPERVTDPREVDHHELSRPDTLVLVEPDGTHKVVAEGLLSPNGCVISADGKSLIVAESLAHRLIVFDVAQDGALGRRRTFADLGSLPPDGICLDAEGAVWLGSGVAGRFVRVREGGAIAAEVDAGGERAVACALGGPDRRTLYMLTATSMATALGRKPGAGRHIDSPRASRGSINSIRVGVGGIG